MKDKTLKVADKNPKVKDSNYEEDRIFEMKDTTLKVVDKNPKVKDSD